MKFAIACYLRLFDEISTELSSLDIGLCITTDEEVGGQYGAAKLAEGGYGGDVLFLPDGGTSWEFEERAKGMQHFEIIAHGKSVHASRPWDGIDPMPILMNALRDMYALFPHEPCGDADHFHSSMSVGKITGGDVSNQLASSVHAFIDIRAFADDHARIRQGITDIQERYEGLSVISLVDGEAYENDISHTDFELFRTLAASQGISVGRATAHGSSDARFFSKRGMPSLMVSPQGGGHHSAYEWVDVNDLELYYAIFKEWTRTLAREASSSSRHSRAEALAKADCPVHRKRI